VRIDEIRQPPASRFRIINHFDIDTVASMVSPSTRATSVVTNFRERTLKPSQFVSHQTVRTGIESISPSKSVVVNAAIRLGSDRTCGLKSDPMTASIVFLSAMSSADRIPQAKSRTEITLNILLCLHVFHGAFSGAAFHATLSHPEKDPLWNARFHSPESGNACLFQYRQRRIELSERGAP